MRNIILSNIKWWQFVILLFIFASCKKGGELSYFDTSNEYIYFGYPNPNNRAIERYIDSVDYSFALDTSNPSVKTIAIPVKVAGIASGQDRSYSYVIDEANSYYDKDLVNLSSPVIRAGKLTDTLYLEIENKPVLRDTVMYLTLRLQDNEQFSPGHESNTSIRVKFTNQLPEPKWWFTWRNYFGTYYPEVYQKWMQIYYLGADPSPDLYGTSPGPFYYWDNMPNTASYPSWYPVTFMYVGVLKKYFIDNPTYPGGDETKPRILLP